MNSPPRKIPETGLFRDVWKEVNKDRDFMREIALLGGRNIRKQRTLNGTLIVAEAVQAVSSAPASIRRFLIREMHDDYILCDEVNGDVGIFVAKPWRLRRTPFDGQTLTYQDENAANYNVSFAYSNPIKRTATIGTTTETQTVVPRYEINQDYIFGTEAENGTGVNGADIIDLNVDGRAWARTRL